MPSRIYKRLISALDPHVPQRFLGLWNHPAGPKTIFFWAPLGKWSLVIAGLGDLNRPPELISMNQSAALGVTGIIWSRYSLVIIPKNYSLFLVNVLVACTGFYQIGRVTMYRRRTQKSED